MPNHQTAMDTPEIPGITTHIEHGNHDPADDFIAQAEFQRFVEAISVPGDILEIRAILHAFLNRNGERHPSVSFWTRAGTQGFPTNIATLNAQGYSVYIGINPRHSPEARGAENVVCARNLFADFDRVDLVVAKARIQDGDLPDPTLIVASGHGFHAYWGLQEPIHNLDLWTRCQKELIVRLGTDSCLHDPTRVMRLPGFWNTKSDPWGKSAIVEVTPERVFGVLPSPLTFFSRPNGCLKRRMQGAVATTSN
jgi:hypothetical protein